MGKAGKKAVRAEFRNSVFKRDCYKCRVCGKAGKDRQGGNKHESFHKGKTELVFLDAHHIADRNLFTNGGYNIANGISLCDSCHLLAEIYHQTGVAYPNFSPD